MSAFTRALLAGAAIAALLRIAYTAEKVTQWFVRKWA